MSRVENKYSDELDRIVRQLVSRAPKPNTDSRGDLTSSLDDDRQIMRQLAGLRAEANRLGGLK